MRRGRSGDLANPPYAQEGAVESAQALIGLVQDELSGREGEVLDPGERRQLYLLQSLGIACVGLVTGKKALAKDAQLIASADALWRFVWVRQCSS